MNADFASVVLPFRDAAPTVEEALRSVLGERAVGEVICVDDGSRDDGPARVAAIAARDPRVRLVPAAGQGVAEAMAEGVRRARGAFLARMDADDVSRPGRIDACVARLRGGPSLGAVATQVDAEGSGPGLARYVAWQNALLTPADHARELFVESPLCQPATTLRASALAAVGGYREVPFPEDWDVFARLDAGGFGLAKVAERLLAWRHREDRATFRDPRCAPDALVRARAAHLPARLARLGVPHARPFVVWGAGKAGKRLARALEPAGLFPTAFLDIDAAKIGRSARGAPVRPPEDVLAGPAADAPFVLVVVAAAGARDVVRARLVAAGRVEGVDFLAAS